jgi:hypothetical protein
MDYATHTVNLGRLDLGNNHHTGHLFAELAKGEHPELDALRDLPAHDDVLLTYSDKYGNTYTDTFDNSELCDMVRNAQRMIAARIATRQSL